MKKLLMKWWLCRVFGIPFFQCKEIFPCEHLILTIRQNQSEERIIVDLSEWEQCNTIHYMLDTPDCYVINKPFLTVIKNCAVVYLQKIGRKDVLWKYRF